MRGEFDAQVQIERIAELPWLAPLRVRMHVPLWLDNLTSFTLSYYLRPLQKQVDESTIDDVQTEAFSVQHTRPGRGGPDSSYARATESEVQPGALSNTRRQHLGGVFWMNLDSQALCS